MYSNNNILFDFNQDGKPINWVKHKNDSLYLSDVYEFIDETKKANRIRSCGQFLEFREYSDNTKKLQNGNFCKARLCPMCAWRRSKKIFGQMSKIMNELQKEQYQFVFLTLTIKNVPAAELTKAIDILNKGFTNLLRTKAFKSAFLGSFRALEVTYNSDKSKKAYGTYHPHLHSILIAPKNYFENPHLYLSQKAIRELWARSVKADYLPLVNVQKVKGNTKKAVCEISKYSVKSSDYLFFDDIVLSSDVVTVLDQALKGRRLVSLTGLFRETHKKLNLDDFIDGDLNLLSDVDNKDLDYIITTYQWVVGFNNYIKI